MDINKIYLGDALEIAKTFPNESVDCIITSPPYWGLRDYGVDGQMGMESSPEEFIAKMVGLFGELKRVLKNEGTLWLNMGDAYAGTPNGRKAENITRDMDDRTFRNKPFSTVVNRSEDRTTKNGRSKNKKNRRALICNY